jgi:lysozyme
VGVYRLLRLRPARGFSPLLVSYLDLLDHGLRIEEGTRAAPYLDTRGYTTIGIGRNLTTKPLKPDEIEYLFKNDKADAERDARSLLPGFDELSDIRKYVLCDLAFNLGQIGLSGFKRFLLAVHEQRWADAAMELRNSVAFKQEPRRFTLLANAMETDTL